MGSSHRSRGYCSSGDCLEGGGVVSETPDYESMTQNQIVEHFNSIISRHVVRECESVAEETRRCVAIVRSRIDSNTSEALLMPIIHAILSNGPSNATPSTTTERTG